MITTITTTGPEDQLLGWAYGRGLNLGRNANQAEVKQQVIQYLRNYVQEQQNAAAIEAALATVVPIAPT
jgi:hypothetical protein